MGHPAEWGTGRFVSCSDVRLGLALLEAAKDSAEEAEGTALIRGGEMETAEHEAKVVLVCGLHVCG